jgi:hypothetical protein
MMQYPDRYDGAEKDCDIAVQAQDVDGYLEAEKKILRVPQVSGVVYSGGKLTLEGWDFPVVIDVEGVEFDKVLLIADHRMETSHRLGSVEATIKDGKIYYSGKITGSNETARNIIEQAKQDEEWEVSIHASVKKYSMVASGSSKVVNGRNFTGPFYHVTKSVLVAVSVVTRGADTGNTLDIAAKLAAGGFKMEEEFVKWLEAKGITDVESLGDELVKTLKAAYDAEKAADEPDADDDVNKDVQAAVKDARKQIRAAQLEEEKRVDGIRKVCAEYQGKVEQDKMSELKAQAISGEISTDKLELELVKAARPEATAAIGPGASMDGPKSTKVIEAAIRMSGAESGSDVEKDYDDKELEAAMKYRQIGTRDLIRVCAQMDGLRAPRAGASVGDFVEAAISSASLSNILSNVANKALAQSYQRAESIAKKLSKKLSANDFKEHTGYRLTGDRTLEEVGPDGEIKHASISDEESYSYAVDTFAKMLVLTRQMIINDDLGAFTEIPARYGQGAMETLERKWFELLLDNTDGFFSSDNNNLLAGADYSLGSAALDSAVKLLEEQTDQDGSPIVVTATDLLVPPALRGTAERLYRSQNLKGATDEPEANIHEGRYQPHSSPFLSNTTFHASASDEEWYLFADPVTVPAFGIAYLNGREAPVAEEVSVPSNILGKGWRVYFDFGVTQIDHRGAVKSLGNDSA